MIINRTSKRKKQPPRDTWEKTFLECLSVIWMDMRAQALTLVCICVQDRVQQEWWGTRCLATVFLETRSTPLHAWSPQACVRVNEHLAHALVELKTEASSLMMLVLVAFQPWEFTSASPLSTSCRGQTARSSMNKEGRRIWRLALFALDFYVLSTHI